MIPPRLAPFVFGLVLSGMMSCIVSLVATYRALGMVDGFFGLWISAWLFSWAVACPAILMLGPVVRQLVARNTAAPKG